MTSPPAPALARPLTRSERFFWLLDRAFGTNHAELAALDGALSEGALEAALESVGSRHPVLGSRFAADGKLRFEPAEGSLRRMALEIRSWDGTYGPVLRRTLEPFAPGGHPLVRVVWFRREPGSALLALIPHHVVADGISGMALLREVLRALQAPGEDGDPRPPLPGLEGMFPAHTRGVRSVWRAPLLVARDATLWFRRGLPRRVPGFRPVARGAVRILSFSMDPPELDALRQRCRVEGATVQGALGAACLTALRAEFPGRGGIALGLRTPVDLRRRLDRPVAANDLGNFISVPLTVHRVRGDAGFWTVARDVRARLHRRVDRGDGHVVWRTLPPSWLLPASHAGARRAASLFAVNPPAVMISNLGAIPPVPEGPLRVKTLSFVVPPMPCDPLSLCVSSYGGTLTVLLAHDPGALTAGAADRIHARFCEELGRAKAGG